MAIIIPKRLAATCNGHPDREDWLQRLPGVVNDLKCRWSLRLDPPFDSDEVSCAWVAPGTRSDGRAAVLKIGMPHMEAEHEIAGLRFWDGDPTVRLLEADTAVNAMLLERCEPGTWLRTLPEPEQDVVMAGLLRRLWRVPPAPHPFRPLSMMTDQWGKEAIATGRRGLDTGLLREGLELFQTLPHTASEAVLLATDLHAGNVLQAQREPWLVIDPKPFVGDPAYDATQHLFNCDERLRSVPADTIRRFSDLLGVDHERVHLWMFARAAVDPRDDWEDPVGFTRALAP